MAMEHTIMMSGKVILECNNCNGELTLVCTNEVDNVLVIEPCNGCIVKKANEMADDYKKLLNEKVTEVISEAP